MVHNADQSLKTPVTSALSEMMKIDFLFSKEGKVWLLHDQPLAFSLEWLEYDIETEQVTLVDDRGGITPLGVPLPAEKGRMLQAAGQVAVMLTRDGKAETCQYVPLVLSTVVN